MSFDLDGEQRKAVLETRRPVLVLAGAGSGKTRLITAKIVHLVERCALPPQRVLALTFTRKAAREMAERLRAVLGERAQAVRVCTFMPSVWRCSVKCRSALDCAAAFSLLDPDDAKRLLGEVAEAQGAALNALAEAVGRQRQLAVSPEEIIAACNDERVYEVARAHRRYAERLRLLNAVDFDDLILRPLAVCRSDNAMKSRLQQRFGHILVDEWQDTNLAQYRLFCELVGMARLSPWSVTTINRSMPGAVLIPTICVC